MEHFSYAPHPNYFYLEIVASLSYSGSLATVLMVETGEHLEQYAMPNGPTLEMVRPGNSW